MAAEGRHRPAAKAEATALPAAMTASRAATAAANVPPSRPVQREASMAKGWYFCILFALQTSSAWGQIRVMAPEWLVRSFSDTHGRITGSTSVFGAPFYGDRVLGSIVYGESGGKDHCTADDYFIPEPPAFETSSHSEKVRLINIVLVKRGKCSFTTKVKAAFEHNAHAVIIVDNQELTRKDLQNTVVADDGFGANIKIPSVLVTKEDGQKLIQAAKEAAISKTQAIVELAWDVPADHVVVTDLWMSSGSHESMRFLKDFAPMRKTLNEVMTFQPHYHVFSVGATSPQAFQDLCSDASGLYCAEDPDGTGPITGKDVLNEDVRQMCIHEVHKVTRSTELSYRAGKPGVSYSREFWDYIGQLPEYCPMDASNPQDRFGLECSTRLMNRVGVDVGKVDACIRENGTAYLKREQGNPAWSPRALRINGWRYSGIMDADLVTKAICTGFITTPAECAAITKPRDPFVPYQASTDHEVSYLEMFLWLLVLCLVMFAGLLLYKRYLKKEMRASIREEVMLEVEAQIGEYHKMMGSQ